MSERKLASIQQIETLSPIEGADKIEKATMLNLGWECVVKKNEFKIGDKVIYCEVDSVMPDKPEYEFLRTRNFRIKTIKLKNQVSQGLILPITSLGSMLDPRNDFKLGDDVTELLGITKYLSKSEIEEANQQFAKKHWTKNYKATAWLWKHKWFRKWILPNKTKSDWPDGISHTDEDRIQNMPKVLLDFADKDVYATEKIDYQSVTFISKQQPKFKGLLGKLIPIKKNVFIVCTRNHATNDKSSLYWKIANKYNLEKICKENPGIVIQGEQGDTKVQGNKYGLKEPTMWVFNIVDTNRKYHYNLSEMILFCRKYNLQHVPVLEVSNNGQMSFGVDKLSKLGSTVNDLVEFSKGKSLVNPKIEREGVVIRCIENGKKILSFKVINPNFLLKFQDDEK